jgi:hypothetical protein
MSHESKPHRFYRDHVAPSIEDWRADETAIHKAQSVATNLTHLADHYFLGYSDQPNKVLGASSLKDFKNNLAARYPDYGLIRDVCDAHKHVELKRKSRNVTNANQTEIGSMGWGEAQWGEGRWGSPDEVIITDDNGSKHHFITIVSRVQEMWKDLLGLNRNSSSPASL